MRTIFFLYLIIKSDYKSVNQALKCLRHKYNPIYLLIDSFYCSYKYGTSIDDYFSFRFYAKKAEMRRTFATTTYMYNFHKTLNNKKYTQKIDDKIQFRKYFSHLSGESDVFENHKSFIQWIKDNKHYDFVIKDPLGTIGKSVHFVKYIESNGLFIFNSKELNIEMLFNSFSNNGKIYVEPKIKQHHTIQKLAPNALNTVRIITIVNNHGIVDIISAAFRISLLDETDNFSTGNLAAAIDISTGTIISPGIKRLAACSDSYDFHPVTGQKILGFEVPHWEEVIKLVNDAAKIFPEVRTVGWDVAILEEKPIIIEGNPSWNKGAPQIPLDKGIKYQLDNYL